MAEEDCNLLLVAVDGEEEVAVLLQGVEWVWAVVAVEEELASLLLVVEVWVQEEAVAVDCTL